MVTFYIMWLNIFILLRSISNTTAEISFPIMKRDESMLQIEFNYLLKSKADVGLFQKLIHKMNPFSGTDVFCDLKDEQKTLLCSFFLVNEPYGLKLKLQSFENLDCIQNKLTSINMFECPFAIVKTDGELDEGKRYLISQADRKEDAIIYIRDLENNDIDNLYLDGVANGVMKIEELEEMVNIRVLSKEGKKYIFHFPSAAYADFMLKRYLNYLDSAKTSEESEVAETVKNFEVCQLSLVQQLFLCDLLVKHVDMSYRLALAEYKYEACRKINDKFFAFTCPFMYRVDKQGKNIENLKYRYILSGSHEPNAAIGFHYEPDMYHGFYPCHWIEILDSDILQNVDERPYDFGLGDVKADTGEKYPRVSQICE